MAQIYLILAIVGTAVPYARFVPWVLEHGLDPRVFVAELFATRIGGFFALDVIVSAVVVLVFIRQDGRARGMHGLWLPRAATLLIGVSCGLPLFLYLREVQGDARRV